MSVVIVTGAAGLIGSAAARHFANKGMDVVGIDNDMRKQFFGADASTTNNRVILQRDLGVRYTHCDVDIRNKDALNAIFQQYRSDLALVVHAAAQPSHDWAASEPAVDFEVNALGTLHLLEATRSHAPNAVFAFLSTNKVYGDRPNMLPLVEQETRWEIEAGHCFEPGINEQMPIDGCLHSLFGVSKASADLMVQEYGRYFGLATACFRGGCLTGPQHAGTQLHGFLSYLMRCCISGKPYTVFGHEGKQVRDNIHCDDLVGAIDCFFESPRSGEVYNIGGGRFSNCSMLEAISLCEQLSGKKLNWKYSPESRRGDHQWWISDLTKFKSHYPQWVQKYNMNAICKQIYEANVELPEMASAG